MSLTEDPRGSSPFGTANELGIHHEGLTFFQSSVIRTMAQGVIAHGTIAQKLGVGWDRDLVDRTVGSLYTRYGVVNLESPQDHHAAFRLIISAVDNKDVPLKELVPQDIDYLGARKKLTVFEEMMLSFMVSDHGALRHFQIAEKLRKEKKYKAPLGSITQAITHSSKKFGVDGNPTQLALRYIYAKQLEEEAEAA